MPEKKLLLGPKVRRLRKEQRLTQAQMAADLDISPAYLNLIEGNQRPLSAQVLVKIAAAYDIDLPAFARDDAPERAAKLRELFSKPALRDLPLATQDFHDITSLSPEAYEAVLKLAQKITHSQNPPQSPGTFAPDAPTNPADEIQGFFDQRPPYFPELEKQAKALRIGMGLREIDVAEAIDAPLQKICPFSIQIFPARIMGFTLRRYDPHGQRLLLNRMLSNGSKRFQILLQYILNQYSPMLERHVQTTPWTFDTAKTSARIQLASYIAAATLMPYGLFLQAAQDLSYDVEALALEFDVTHEQVAYRLVSLRRPGHEGLAFFMMQYDGTGHQTKALGFQGFPEIDRFDRQFCEAALTPPYTGGLKCSRVAFSNGQGVLLLTFTCQKPNLSFSAPSPALHALLGCLEPSGQQTIYRAALDPRGPETPAQGYVSWHMAPNPIPIDPMGDMGADENRRDLLPYTFA